MVIREGSNVHYAGDLPDGWSHDGYVVALTPGTSGAGIASVEFSGGQQDVPASELALDPADAQYADD